MSFVERHKLWLLPLLGVGALGVVFLNMKLLGTDAPKPAPPLAVNAASPASPAPATPVSRPLDIWTDLRRLEAPSPSLNDPASLLQGGSLSLPASSLPPAGPAAGAPFGQGIGEGMPLPRALPPAPSGKAITPLGPVDFIFQGASGAEAWFNGRPYRVGQSPDGQHRVVAIGARSVRLQGPEGTLERSTVVSSPASLEVP